MNEKYIPNDLKNLPQWVGVKNNSKLPLFYNPECNLIEAASSSNPKTWSTFEKITESIVKKQFDSYGFVFHDNGIVGIDIDLGFDENGFLSPLAIDIMRVCHSYTEYSRSHRGIHVYLKGKLPFGGRNNRNGVEIYQTGRYFIVTGEKLIFENIIENQEAIDYIIEKYFPDLLTVSSTSTKKITNIYQPIIRIETGEKLTITREYPEIKEGSRNISLTSLAGQLYNQGYSVQAVFDEIKKVNALKCKPPLDNRELKTIVNSIARYSRNGR